MLNKLRILALCTTALAGTTALAQTATTPTQPAAAAQPAPSVFDLTQLPAFKGKVQQFTLTPRGDIDGLILTDGTEVKTPPHLTVEVAAAFKAGDAVTIRGLKAAAIPLVAASSVTNDATGVAVIDNGPAGKGKGKKGGPDQAASDGTSTDLTGKIKVALHGRKGEVNGALLEDGTAIRLPPPEAERLASLLVPGQTVAVQGMLIANSYGKVLEVRALGTSADKMSEVQADKHGKKHHPKG